MKEYPYRPVRFYLICFSVTWAFWITASRLDTDAAMLLMLLGLCTPAVTALITVACSRSPALKQDFKRKIIGFYRLQPFHILLAILCFIGIVILPILISLLFGQPVSQFAFTQDFSFSIRGTSALFTILLAAIIEEVGWRGYGEDSVAYYCSWFKESIIFGIVWAFWHLPLFWINGIYHFGLRELGAGYMLNFLFSVIPLGFLTTWVYVKNNRSLLACVIFHLFVNLMQEKVAMTPETKCIETIVITGAAILVVALNRSLFFERDHVRNLLHHS